MAGISSSIYNLLFRKNTVMLGTVFAAAFAVEMAWDTASASIWDNINKGRQWKDIKQKYLEAAEE
ncbi:ubiquinol-cytochrome C reductase [Lepidopterella palustris CBS 459.81]|uniref:Complex III subunit 9 n=1 Tax=Lepidopterella palustris CBS 459.81 TaxID=1314670 RepID=A0A8E2EG99_9PEZI|nr:ubiquinol-cytochrome C reductase [Lepidopterella palustris CBS 459.81]